MWIYILASGRNGTLYVGVTNSLARRIAEHREGRGSDFVRKYKVDMLVYAEAYERADEAIAQEKRIKRWARRYKLALVERGNPNWDDLYDAVHLD